MASQEYGLLDQADEDLTHKARLLPIEQRPFQRVAKRMVAADSPIYNPPTALPSPPPEGHGADDVDGAARQAEERNAWRQDMLLDLASLQDSTVRIQLLRDSNEAERARYAAEKAKISATAAAIREGNAALRAELEGARATLARRKRYDELAERITSNRMLKPREEQAAQLAKLDAEIAELERERTVYKQTWAERRDQFGRIVDEGRQMLRLIRDEKEEAERKEGMEEGEADEDEGPEGASSGKGDASAVGTPRPDAAAGQTPNPSFSGGHQLAAQRGLLSAPSPAPSFGGAGTPARGEESQGDDADMAEAGEVANDTDIEEGEAEENTPDEKMDES
ncbi:uncharacterized protein K452DRAFT_293703 [Aplosporella prunicola CBS 121167]|uniref:Uncharacterized protein n=1 Tax=Aplosporella prunicola CBS 121167 TaxID=1176127 RepID=A0A6A6BWM3_9PEZI|nr:uncharacterized protein K452DRAFT_293703 [Aplosporella prunicola CBS 121167]KAF2147244.1 hypothetical protein K452DRAFT_293703 [Aplosporella prunicola CBS 121167]